MHLSELPVDLHLHLKDLLQPKEYFSSVPLVSKDLRKVSGVAPCEQQFGSHKEHCYKMLGSSPSTTSTTSTRLPDSDATFSHCQHYCYGPQCYEIKSRGDYDNRIREFGNTFHLEIPLPLPSSFRAERDDLSLAFLQQEEKRLAAAGITLTFPHENLHKVCLSISPRNDIIALRVLTMHLLPLLKKLPSPYPNAIKGFSRQDAKQLHNLLKRFIKKYKDMTSLLNKSPSGMEWTEDQDHVLHQCLSAIDSALYSLPLWPRFVFPDQLRGWPDVDEMYHMLQYLVKEAFTVLRK